MEELLEKLKEKLLMAKLDDCISGTAFRDIASLVTQIEQLHKLNVMQAEGSDESEGAAVASEGQGEANMSAGCCDHVEWVVRLGILQCANCGKPH